MGVSHFSTVPPVHDLYNESFPKSFGKSTSLPLTAGNALAWIIVTCLEVAHPPVECIKYEAAFE